MACGRHRAQHSPSESHCAPCPGPSVESRDTGSPTAGGRGCVPGLGIRVPLHPPHPACDSGCARGAATHSTPTPLTQSHRGCLCRGGTRDPSALGPPASRSPHCNKHRIPFISFKFYYIHLFPFRVHVCVCVCMYGIGSCVVSGQLEGVRSLLPPDGSQAWNSGHQARLPFPAQPSHQPWPALLA